MANDSTPSFLANPLPLIAILMLAAGVLVRTLPLESGRAGDADRASPSIADRQDVPARLWQDPFSAVNAVQKAGAPAGGETVSHAPQTLLDPIRRISERRGTPVPPVQVIGVTVSTSAFAEDAESRRRTRYAVISGLIAAQYSPFDPEGVGYVQMPNAQVSKSPVFIPFEWFKRGENERLVVLWLEENVLGRAPAERLGVVLRTICGTTAGQPLCKPEEVQPRIKIVGPGSSSALQALVQEMAKKDGAFQFNGASLDFYSPLATAPHGPLAESLSDRVRGCLLPSAAESTECAVRIVRTIGGDDKLAQLMTAELALRGVNAEGWSCNDRVVIVVERDTTYGKELATQFRKALMAAPACQAKPGESEEETKQRLREAGRLIWEFGYLRGLDGVIAGGTTEKSAPARNDAKRLDFDALDAPTALRERAEGRGQFDYVRRLAAEIGEREKGEKLEATMLDRLRLEGRPKVKAIGVLGNDVYDKLLILQALHGVFPYSMYFTTDLDARLLHPDQGSWSRNLIVASNYGFALAPGLQGGTPPFRNGYQTSTYFATLLALQTPSAALLTPKLDQWLQPQVYEIGRTQEIQLWNSDFGAMSASDSGTKCTLGNILDCQSVHPIPQRRAHAEVLAILSVCLGVALLWYSCMTLRNFARRSPWLLTALSIATIAALIVGLSGWLRTWVERIQEPFAWFEGVSLWPTQLIFVIATIFALYWIQRTARSFGGIQEEIGADFFALNDRAEFCVELDQSLRGWWRRWCRVATDRAYAKFLVARQTGDEASGWQPEGARAWLMYTETCRFANYYSRPLRLTLICFVFGLCLFMLGPQYLPFRGPAIWWITIVLYALCGFALLFLVFQGVYITQMTTNFVRWIARHDTNYPARTIDEYAPRLGMVLTEPDASLAAALDERKKRVLEPWIDFALIVRLTGEVDRYIYPPFIVLALFALAQIRLFDDWQPSPWMLAVVVLVVAFAVWSSHILRRAAEEARDVVLSKYEDCLLQNAGTSGGCGPCGPTELIKTLITRVRETRKGAFLPFFQRPAPRAVLIPFGGLGGISILEFLLTRHT